MAGKRTIAEAGQEKRRERAQLTLVTKEAGFDAPAQATDPLTASGGDTDAQARILAEGRLLTTQRQSVARQIGGTHGNKHLQGLLGTLAKSKAPTGGAAVVQRTPTTVPAPFIGGSAFNDSAVTFTPRGVLWVNGRQVSSSTFPGRNEGVVQIRAGTRGVAQLHVDVHVFEDNMLINQTWDQGFYVSWDVAAAQDGTLTVGATPAVTINPRAGDTTMSSLQSVSPAQGPDFVMVSPIIQGPSTTGGIAAGVSREVNFPGSIMQRPFRLRIEVVGVQPPQGEVTLGPIRILRSHEVRFERPRQSAVSGSQQSALIAWYQSLPEETRESIQSGAEAITLEAHASTTGTPESNLILADQRRQAVETILARFVGNRAVFHTRSPGDYEAPTPDEVESEAERRVDVSVWETASDTEGNE